MAKTSSTKLKYRGVVGFAAGKDKSACQMYSKTRPRSACSLVSEYLEVCDVLLNN